MNGHSSQEIIALKKQFDRDLRHIKVLMVSKKRTMSNKQWLLYVRRIKRAIIKSPSEFLSVVPGEQILREAIEKVFTGFLEDQKMRDSQKFQNRWRYDI